MENASNYDSAFKAFLRGVTTTTFNTNITATGTQTIQQSERNELRRAGLKALLADLTNWYGDEFDVVETKDGIVIVAENEPNDFTFSWELKSTIKSIDYDPFIQANNFEEANAAKEQKKKRIDAEKAAKCAALEAKRAAKLAELAEQRDLTNN